MKASFMQRLFAYIIDVVIVSVVCSSIGMFLNNNSSQIAELNEELSKAEESLTEIINSGDTANYEEEMQKVMDIEYKISRASVLTETVSFIVVFGYFVVIQFMLKGKTFGKMILKIKVVDKKNKEPSFGVILLRTFIIEGLLTSFLSLVTILFLSKNAYIMFNGALSILFSIFVIVSAIMVLYRKDKRGLHDIMAGSLVIKDEK